ncbi:MAG: 50S ribosomal protein L23 [Candidatus Diapherotrites archaeon]|uniref:Large ribosomal subunit protein uL23 n=1 Tax=Candidatus Iainarchaeum sp. TaxID=3101447 RepID=A0A8T4KTU1_9ARCH|nr:50S ribosomal protein L23 [Candidatus Diapherotrites archaeon]
MAEKKIAKKGKAAEKQKPAIAKAEKKTAGEKAEKKIEAPAQKEKAPEKRSSSDIEKELKNFEIIKFALISEKAVNMIERENKLTFIVNQNADKPSIKKAIEEMHKVKVDNVKIIRDRKGRKKAIVKIGKGFKASDVATRLGVI